MHSSNGSVAIEKDYNFSVKLTPTMSPNFYTDAAHKYFNSIDSTALDKTGPKYSKMVIRWEWKPWLLLTGHKSWMMKLDYFLTWYPTEVINRDCRFFKVQPFARCRVTFHYLNPNTYFDIYEEFTFNNQGEITFVEAWSDHPGYLPMDTDDLWAESKNVKRMSWKVPGLGSEDGKYDKKSLKTLSKNDKDLAGLYKRLKHPVFFWMKEGVRFLKDTRNGRVPESN